ncbi:MAG: ABC transporter permease, partial [Candidatus Dormibacteraeota bacterium]|nr:ABC transporter permease [Candidatus Dormibacteraeota bacterium]
RRDPFPHVTAAIAFLRIFFIGGLISYRALFNWIRPAVYIPSMLGAPIFQILFFTYLGRYSGVRNDAYFVVGNAVQVCSMSAIYAMTMALANERNFQTLSPLLATPANRLALVIGRGIPVIANGLLVSAFGFLVGVVLLHFRPGWHTVPALVLVLLVTVTSCTGLGMVLGSFGLRVRDVFFLSNLAYFLMLLFCGINVPLDVLPPFMQAIGNVIPLTHGVAAARVIAGGGGLTAASGQLASEAAVGVAYVALAFTMFRFFEHQGRSAGVFERL